MGPTDVGGPVVIQPIILPAMWAGVPMPVEFQASPNRGLRWPPEQAGPATASSEMHQQPVPATSSSTPGPAAGGGAYRVHWTVDARKLRSNDKQAVSPPFELSFGPHFPSVIFKMMAYPKVMG